MADYFMASAGRRAQIILSASASEFMYTKSDILKNIYIALVRKRYIFRFNRCYFSRYRQPMRGQKKCFSRNLVWKRIHRIPTDRKHTVLKIAKKSKKTTPNVVVKFSESVFNFDVVASHPEFTGTYFVPTIIWFRQLFGFCRRFFFIC